MNRYLTIYIPKTAVPAPVSRFLRTQAGLTKKQISQAKFRPGGIRKNGQQCRVTENAYPGDQIIVCWKRTMWILPSWNLHPLPSIRPITISSSPQTQFHILIPQLQNLQVLMSILTFIIHWLQRHSFFLSWRSYTKTRISSP